jgi:hypothetical protein
VKAEASLHFTSAKSGDGQRATIYAPGVSTKDDIAAVVGSVDRPVNVVMGLEGVQLSRAALSALHVKRISVGSALARAAFGAFLRAAREMRERGTFEFANEAVGYHDITPCWTTDSGKDYSAGLRSPRGPRDDHHKCHRVGFCCIAGAR